MFHVFFFSLPVLNFLVLSLVFRSCLCFCTRLARKLKALLHRAEELAAHVVGVLEGGDDVGRTRDGLEEFYALEGVGDLLHALQTVTVSVDNRVLPLKCILKLVLVQGQHLRRREVIGSWILNF
jgi:hypothetical protein